MTMENMVIEIVVSILALSLTSLGLVVYCHWKKLQKQDRDLKNIGNMIVKIVKDFDTTTRERSVIEPLDQV